MSAALRRWPTIRTRRNGRELLVNVGDFHQARKTVADPAKQIGAQLKPESADASYTREAARRMAYQADMARLALRQREGEILELRDVIDATERTGKQILSAVDRATLPTSKAEEVVAAVNSAGLPGARGFLRQLNRDIRTAIADACRDLAEQASADSEQSAAVDLPLDLEGDDGGE